MRNITCYDSDNNLLKTLYQWDSNQTMTVRGVDMPPFPVFHFCNRRSRVALVVTPEVSGSDLIVKIPNILLQQAEPITAYLYHDTDNEGHRTMTAIHIPVIPRPRPDDYEFEENIEPGSVATVGDVQNLQRQIDEMKSYVDGLHAAVTRELIIPSTGWDTGAQESSPGEMHVDIAQEDITEEMIPIISILPGYTDSAGACGMSTASRTISGALRLYAKKAPTEEIRASLTLLTASYGSASGGSAGDGAYVLPVATATRLGGVKIGDNVSVESDGTISVQADELLDDVVASDEDVNGTLDNIFGAKV